MLGALGRRWLLRSRTLAFRHLCRVGVAPVGAGNRPQHRCAFAGHPTPVGAASRPRCHLVDGLIGSPLSVRAALLGPSTAIAALLIIAIRTAPGSAIRLTATASIPLLATVAIGSPVRRFVRRAPLLRHPPSVGPQARRTPAANTTGVQGSGSDLLSQGNCPQVPSALAGLTSVFGMGTGVALPP